MYITIYILIMYYYIGYCRTIIILLGEKKIIGGGARGGGWQGEGPEGEVGRLPTPRGFPSRPRGSRLASPRLAPRLACLARVYKGFIGAVTVTGAAADAVTVAVAVRG